MGPAEAASGVRPRLRPRSPARLGSSGPLRVPRRSSQSPPTAGGPRPARPPTATSAGQRARPTAGTARPTRRHDDARPGPVRSACPSRPTNLTQPFSGRAVAPATGRDSPHMTSSSPTLPPRASRPATLANTEPANIWREHEKHRAMQRRCCAGAPETRRYRTGPPHSPPAPPQRLPRALDARTY